MSAPPAVACRLPRLFDPVSAHRQIMSMRLDMDDRTLEILVKSPSIARLKAAWSAIRGPDTMADPGYVVSGQEVLPAEKDASLQKPAPG